MTKKAEFNFARVEQIGRSHIRPLKSSRQGIPLGMQDATVVAEHATGHVAVVCDGCSQGVHAIVGAKLGAAIVAQEVSRHAQKLTHVRSIDWSSVQRRIIERLSVLRDAIGDPEIESPKSVVGKYLLFTIMVCVTIGDSIAVAHIGDGFVITEHDYIDCEAVYADDLKGTGLEHHSPYLGYALSRENGFITNKLEHTLEFNVVFAKDGAAAPQMVCIATDGAGSFIRHDHAAFVDSLLAPIEAEKYAVANFVHEEVWRHIIDSSPYVRQNAARDGATRSSVDATKFSDDVSLVVIKRQAR